MIFDLLSFKNPIHAFRGMWKNMHECLIYFYKIHCSVYNLYVIFVPLQTKQSPLSYYLLTSWHFQARQLKHVSSKAALNRVFIQTSSEICLSS